MLSGRGERVDIARNTSNTKEARLEETTDLSYDDLTDNLEFVAGLIDAKGSFTSAREVPVLFLYDTNESLLRSLADGHGGSVSIAMPAGTDFSRDGNNSTMSHDSYRWQLLAPQLYHFLHEIRNHTYLTREIVDSLI